MLSAALTASLAALGAAAAVNLATGLMAAPDVPSSACPGPRAQAMDRTARASAPWSTQATNPPIRASAPSRGELELRLPKLLGADKLAEARALVDAYLQEHPRDDGILFDASRVASRQRDLRAAAAYPTRALRAGWRDDAAHTGD